MGLKTSIRCNNNIVYLTRRGAHELLVHTSSIIEHIRLNNLQGLISRRLQSDQRLLLLLLLSGLHVMMMMMVVMLMLTDDCRRVVVHCT